MKRIQTLIIFVLTLFLAVSFSVTSVLAASGNKPETDPPYGLKVQGAAKGTKLEGVVYAELSDQSIVPPCIGHTTLNATVRLSKGKEVGTFTTGPLLDGCYNLGTEEWAQQDVIDAITDAVNDYFFSGEDMVIVLKDISTWGQVSHSGIVHFLFDVVFAAQ